SKREEQWQMNRNMRAIKKNKIRLLCMLAALASALLGGCASDKSEDNSEQYASVNLLPCQEFFLSPLPSLLTNGESFHQRISFEVTHASSPAETVSGELTGEGSRLFFIPDPKNLDNKRKQHMGISIIWDAEKNSGFIQNEALQSYAPFSLPIRYTYAGMQAGQPVSGEIAVTGSDGSKATYAVTRFPEAKGMVSKVETRSGMPGITLNTFKPAMQKVSPQLFQAPTGFTRYETVQAMMKEAVARQIGMGRDDGKQTKDLEVFDKMPQRQTPTTGIR
ncbi:MAG: hypothetical protein JWN25_361, partial [Verrucomicrobiales bacterium]|nr:hypothetical protein [Verrucomicrobiales bacterium]